MLSFASKYADKGKYSQNGESGILRECLRRMNIQSGRSVELGAADGSFCSNTAELLDEGWSGLLIESDWNLYLKCVDRWRGYPNVRVQCSRVDEHNINAFVDETCDLLSLDTDGSDFQIFRGLKAKPKIVIVEIDSSIPPERLGFNADGAAGYKAMTMAGIRQGYFLLCHTGNIVFVDEQYRHLFPEIIGNGLTNADDYFNRSWLKEEAA